MAESRLARSARVWDAVYATLSPNDARFFSLCVLGSPAVPFASPAARVPPEAVVAAGNDISGEYFRQSAPLPQDEGRLTRKGDIVALPESVALGDDDDESPALGGWNRDTLKDLRSPASQVSLPAIAGAPSNEAKQELKPQHASELNKLSPARLAAKNISLKSADNLIGSSDVIASADREQKPQIVRKLSGEIVRPALRTPAAGRSSGMPVIPALAKAVRFNSHIGHIRYFSQGDGPLPFSAGPSLAVGYERRNIEYRSPGNGEQDSESPPFEWQLVTANFPADLHPPRTVPVMLEAVWLSNDEKSLRGSIAVANIAFHKHVACHFTLDHWKTVSDVCAEYSGEPRRWQTPIGYDCFTFTIKLSDIANLESKTLLFCILYTVNDQEFWDNNYASNFQVNFRTKHMSRSGKDRFQGAVASPAEGQARTDQRQTAGGSWGPLSTPKSPDASGSGPLVSTFDQQIHDHLGEWGRRRLNTKSTTNLARDNIADSVTSRSGAAFSARYDLGASLINATRAAKLRRNEDALYMKSNMRGFGSSLDVAHEPHPSSSSNCHGSGAPQSPKPSLPSASYEELVNRYCFALGRRQDIELDGSLYTRFDKVAPVGKGAFSVVYRATKLPYPGAIATANVPFQPVNDRNLPRSQVFAVKKSKHPYYGPKDRAMKLREIHILQALTQAQHVVHYVDHWEDSSHFYIQTEFYGGGNLEQFLKASGRSARLDAFRVFKVLHDLCLGLKEIHDAGFVHLDIKPANVLIDSDGALKVGDFGLAQPCSFTADLDIEGDRVYMAPEVLRGKAGQAADVFSLGLIALESSSNVVLPDNGPFWVALRRGDLSEIPSLTRMAATESRIQASKQATQSGDIWDGCWISTENLLSSRNGCGQQPQFMVDAGHRSSLDAIVKRMIAPKAAERPRAEQVLDFEGLIWALQAPDDRLFLRRSTQLDRATFPNRYESLIDATRVSKLGKDNDALYMESDISRFGTSLDLPHAVRPTRLSCHRPVESRSLNPSLPSASYEEFLSKYSLHVVLRARHGVKQWFLFAVLDDCQQLDENQFFQQQHIQDQLDDRGWHLRGHLFDCQEHHYGHIGSSTTKWSNSTITLCSISMTTSTVYTTTVHTVTQCPPYVTNCPNGGYVTTDNYTTVCHVTKVQKSAKPTRIMTSAEWTTSTLYATKIHTVRTCPPQVSNCPVGYVTTEIIPWYTTVYAVTGSETRKVPQPTLSGPGSVNPPAAECTTTSEAASSITTTPTVSTKSRAPLMFTKPGCSDHGCPNVSGEAKPTLSWRTTSGPSHGFTSTVGGHSVVPSSPVKAGASKAGLSLGSLVAMVAFQMLAFTQPQVIRVRNGTVNFETDNADRQPWIQLWAALVKETEPNLPDLDMPVNIMDENRIIVPWDVISTYAATEQAKRAMVNTKDASGTFTRLLETEEQDVYSPDWVTDDANKYWEYLRVACPPDSPARNTSRLNSFSYEVEYPGEPMAYTHNGFIQNITKARDPCLQPHLRGLHGTFVESVSMSTTRQLFPLFSGSKLPQNNEILIPGAMYLSDRDFYTGGDWHGPEWSLKRNGLVWRGTASGGRNKENNWWHFHRHRWVQMMNGTTVSAVESGDKARGPTFDLPQVPEHLQEWHDDRLFPWVHYVPFDNSYSDIYAVMDYFLSHDDAAKKIALEGHRWAKQAYRREDMKLDRLAYVADIDNSGG
ncbi:protein phosphatase regulator [Purpureocillium lavendulum]|uniref:Protein phosphatase regulator n=1 Tax=Purpureocillium lavendulum TaxID=1247861 RepID=A0AB34FEN0_9HYPO|nr:protein phosphatase regulator [Purpureocillium lavendulum]